MSVCASYCNLKKTIFEVFTVYHLPLNKITSHEPFPVSWPFKANTARNTIFEVPVKLFA